MTKRRLKKLPRPRPRNRYAGLLRLFTFPLQLAGVAVLVALFTWFLMGLSAKVIHPYRLANQQAVKLEAAKRRLATAKKQQAELKAKLAFLGTDEGAEMLARRLGYYRKGEEPILIRDPNRPEGR